MGKLIPLLIALSGLAASGTCSQHVDPSPVNHFKSNYFLPGDPRLCMEMDRDAKFPVQRFEVLPGIGWDNLQNKVKGQVIEFNYSKCLTTDDGRFLVPDQVFTVPLKESLVDTFAELLDTWHNTSDTTSSSINVNAGLHFGFGSVSGSFSREHTQIKKKQIEDKAVTVRVQLRYNRYQSQLQPDSTLHPAFKRRLLDMAMLLALNQTEMAQYEAQLLVRDFGTHVLSSVTAGASLMKTDFVKKDYVASQTEDKTKVLVSASASFGSFFHMGGSYGHSTDTTDYKSYLKAMTHSYVTSHGGPLMKAFNMSANDWTHNVDMELVPMDRAGDPLSFLITQETLRELPLDLIFQLEKTVRQAIIQYYEMNTISGCTKMGSPNFSFSANFDDGSCEAKSTNMTFGGVYQTCAVQGRYLSHNPCNGLAQVNPKTRTYSCPTGYTAVKLITGRFVGKPEYKRECNSCGWWSTCCHTDTYTAVGAYTAYWCAALGHVPSDSGYLFGGVYSATEDNVITGSKGCPPTFYPRIFLDHQICISDDFAVGAQYSVPFGGFISCSMGNPLSMPGIHPVGSNLQAPKPRPNSLQSFMAENFDPSVWPKHCPKGYSQHLVSINGGCEVRYCLITGALAGPNLPKIKLPPFQNKPNIFHVESTNFMFNRDSQEWFKNEKAYDMNYQPVENTAKMTWKSLWTPESPTNAGQRTDHSSSSSMAPGVAAAIAVIVTIACGLIALAVFTTLQRRRRANRGQRLEDSVKLTDDAATTSQSGGVSYGAVNRNQSDGTCAVDLPTEA